MFKEIYEKIINDKKIIDRYENIRKFEDKNGHCIGNREIMKWLKQPYIKPVYKLTKFEIDLLQSCSQGYSPKYQFKNINSLTEMRKNRYFKGVNRDATIEEIIAKSEVVG